MITAAPVDLLTPLADAPDPRITAAVADFRATVVEVRRLSAGVFALADGSVDHQIARERIDDLVGGMQARADVVGITLDELFRLINADLAGQRIGSTNQPHGDHLRALVDENTRAYAEETTIRREIGRLEQMLPGAAERRLAADRDCAGYVAGWAVRGGGR